MLTKQAKILNDRQIRAMLSFLDTTRDPLRNRLIFLLSARAGLRAKEIAHLTWSMVTDPEGWIGDVIRLPDSASKGKVAAPFQWPSSFETLCPPGLNTSSRSC